MTTLDLLRTQRDAVLQIAAKHGAENLRIFGSVARAEDTEQSDIDLLVTMQENRSLLDLAALKDALEALLHRSTDIVTERGLHPLIRQEILSESRPL